MTNHVLLNNVTHKDLRVNTCYSAEFGDEIASALTFPTEFGDVQREYPILFHTDIVVSDYYAIEQMAELRHIVQNGEDAAVLALADIYKVRTGAMAQPTCRPYQRTYLPANRLEDGTMFDR